VLFATTLEDEPDIDIGCPPGINLLKLAEAFVKPAAAFTIRSEPSISSILKNSLDVLLACTSMRSPAKR